MASRYFISNSISKQTLYIKQRKGFKILKEKLCENSTSESRKVKQTNFL
jgi:hypothetical protein